MRFHFSAKVARFRWSPCAETAEVNAAKRIAEVFILNVFLVYVCMCFACYLYVFASGVCVIVCMCDAFCFKRCGLCCC